MKTPKKKRPPRKRGPQPELLKLDVDPQAGLAQLVRTRPKPERPTTPRTRPK
jgi:hypothetical protein